MAREWKSKKIEILECVLGRQTADFTIYNIKANDEHGNPIDTKLNAFEVMPLGEQTVEASPYYKNGQFESVTVRKPKNGGTSIEAIHSRLELLEEAKSQLESRVTSLEAQVGELNARVFQGGGGATPSAPTSAYPSPDPEAPYGRAADGTPLDDDIPF